jgi:hypothetical protein
MAHWWLSKKGMTPIKSSTLPFQSHLPLVLMPTKRDQMPAALKVEIVVAKWAAEEEWEWMILLMQVVGDPHMKPQNPRKE